MSSPGYVWEQMYGAIRCLAGEGSFESRLTHAAVSSFIRLNDDDLPPGTEVAVDLKFILDWTKRNLAAGELIKVPNDVERRQIVDKIINILCETHRVTFGRQ